MRKSSNQKNFFNFFILILICFLTGQIKAAPAQTAQPVTQPIGILARTWQTTGGLPFPVQPPVPVGFISPNAPVDEVNYICAQWDSSVQPDTVPFAENYSVSEIKLTQQQHFVRLLAGPSSSSNGAWIMRSEYVRGKTPQQLADIFALPNGAPPVEIVNVEMPASTDPVNGPFYVLWTGVCGPIRDWGNGGAVQNRLVADFGTNYFPGYLYTSSSTRNHRQAIGQIALSYKPLAGTGNTWNVADYLDSFIPQAYSDMENVYHSLDYLNYTGFGGQQLQDALTQIGPEKFDNFSFLNFRNALLFGNSILDRRIFCHQTDHFCRHNKMFEKCCKLEANFGIEALGEFDKYNNIHSQTGGLLGYIDFQSQENWIVGIGAAGMYNDLHSITTLRDKGHGENIKFGFYAGYAPKSFFIDGLISFGFDWNKFSRKINFYDIDRTAHSKPRGGDIEIHLQGGFNVLNLITPIARVSYLFNRQNNVTEYDADSLNLNIIGFNTHVIRTNLGIQASHIWGNSDIKVVPQANASWVTDFNLNNRKINANLRDLGNNFSVSVDHKTHCYFAGGVGCNLLFPNCLTIFANYDAELRSDFTTQMLRLGIESKF
ncbi:MAG: autotransporter outer membrane beta-barrel domain-containing protein [Candidatus Babeliales bacterium]